MWNICSNARRDEWNTAVMTIANLDTGIHATWGSIGHP